MATEPSLRIDRRTRPGRLAGRGFALAGVALGATVGVFLAWQAAAGLFLIFAGLLFGVFLDVGARGLGYVWHAPRSWRLAAVSVTMALLVVGGLSFGGYTVVQQTEELVATVQGQLRALRGELVSLGLGSSTSSGVELAGSQPPQSPQSRPEQALLPGNPSGGKGAPTAGGPIPGPLASSFLPDPGAMLQSATSALGATLGGLGNVVIIVFLGLYVALSPDLYRRGALRLLPPGRRPRVGGMLEETAWTLRWWILGQLVSMAAVAVLTFIGLLLIGMPWATLLALQAGLFAFIPYVGIMVGGAVILLTALAQGGTMVLWALGIYALVQLVESYVLTPVVQKRTVDLPPALTIGMLVILGSLFGIWGLALGTPLLVAIRVAVLRLWVEDALGDVQDVTA
jgi:predicted PurR-regulated permease PerM